MKITECPNCKSKEFIVEELQSCSAEIVDGKLIISAGTAESAGFQKMYCAGDNCDYDAETWDMEIEVT